MRKDVALALLGLQPNELDPIRINAAYRNAMQMNHPDRFAQNERLRQHAEEQCKLINEARSVLLEGTWDSEPEAHTQGGRGPYGESSSRDGRQTTATASKSPDTGNDESATGDTEPAKEVSQPVKTSLAPLLDIWVTETSPAILGVIVNLVFYWIDNIMPSSMAVEASLIRLLFMLVQFFYAIVVYPSFFSIKPKISSCSAVSFWNCTVGGFIFGPLWNGNLRRRRRGVSYIVFATLHGLLLVLWIAALGFTFGLLNGNRFV